MERVLASTWNWLLEIDADPEKLHFWQQSFVSPAHGESRPCRFIGTFAESVLSNELTSGFKPAR